MRRVVGAITFALNPARRRLFCARELYDFVDEYHRDPPYSGRLPSRLIPDRRGHTSMLSGIERAHQPENAERYVVDENDNVWFDEDAVDHVLRLYAQPTPQQPIAAVLHRTWTCDCNSQFKWTQSRL